MRDVISTIYWLYFIYLCISVSRLHSIVALHSSFFISADAFPDLLRRQSSLAGTEISAISDTFSKVASTLARQKRQAAPAPPHSHAAGCNEFMHCALPDNWNEMGEYLHVFNFAMITEGTATFCSNVPNLWSCTQHYFNNACTLRDFRYVYFLDSMLQWICQYKEAFQDGMPCWNSPLPSQLNSCVALNEGNDIDLLTCFESAVMAENACAMQDKDLLGRLFTRELEVKFIHALI